MSHLRFEPEARDGAGAQASAKQDYPEALKCYHKAADGGVVRAMYNIGVIWLFKWNRRRKLSPNACPDCGYDLTGNETGMCPECGVGAGTGIS